MSSTWMYSDLLKSVMEIKLRPFKLLIVYNVFNLSIYFSLFSLDIKKATNNSRLNYKNKYFFSTVKRGCAFLNHVVMFISQVNHALNSFLQKYLFFYY